ncbi:unnamed protein product, partial [Scytosiphon promiscuus]
MATDFEALPKREIFSFEDLDPGRTFVVGAVYLGGDLICDDLHVIEVKDRTDALIISDTPTLRTWGVLFKVSKSSAMHMDVNAIAVKALEGASSSRKLVTVEADGYLWARAVQRGPLPEGGITEDTHSLVGAGKGGEFEVDGYVGYTATSLTIVS